MKIDRRCFLSLVIGGAAGTALTPLPWKLTDDSSIWSQNWPWTPVVAKGENFYANSACTLCPGGCGISVRMTDDRSVKIEGQPGHPVNDGGVCVLGLSGLQLLYGPNRVTEPMKRIGKRGGGQWQPISWEAALTELAEKLNQVRAESGPQALGCILEKTYGTVPELFKRLMRAYGSPNVMTTPSLQDSLDLSLKVMHGSDAQMVGYDLENADFIISFGSGLIEGWGSPVRSFRANSSWKDSGVQRIQVETRLSNTAAKADQWVAVNPGTEAALAMGMIHVLLTDNLYNTDFVENYASGFAGWQSLVQEDYTPEKVAAITGVSADAIRRLAQKFAAASHPLAICGRGQGDEPLALSEAMAVHALNALVGNLNQPGGVWAVSKPNYIAWPEVALDAAAESGLATARIDGAGESPYGLSASLLNQLSEIEGGPALKALLISEANPFYTMADAGKFQAQIKQIPFLVSFSSYMDETSMQADLILPNHVYLERYEDVPVAAGLTQPTIGLARPVVEPLYNTMHTGDVLIRLAQEMGDRVASAFPWEDYETCLQETLEDKWDTLDEEGVWVDAEFEVSGWEEAFATASGKFEFGDATLDVSPGYSALAPAGDRGSYPLTLIPFDSMRLANNAIASPPFVMKSVEDTVLKGNFGLVEINPQTAKELDLPEGSVAQLSTPKGKARVKIHYFDGIKPGVVAMPKGLGHRTHDRFTAGKGVNIKELMGPVVDQASGLDAAWGIRAKLTKA